MNRGKIMSKRHQAGLTLIELMLVLAISMAIIVGGLLWYKSVKGTQLVANAIQNLGSLASSVRTQFGPQGNTQGLTNSVALLSSSFPQQMNVVNDGTSISDGWDSAGVTVKPATINGADDAFTIAYADIPQKACNDLAQQTFRNYYSLTVNGTPVKAAADAATACTSGSGTSGGNTLTWEVQLQ